MTVSVSGDTYTIEFQFPQGARFDEIALYADGDQLLVGASTQVIGAVTGFGTLVSMDAAFQTTIAGAETEVGNVWSKGSILVSTGALVNGVARSELAVTLQTGGTADQIEQNTAFPNAATPFSLVVEFVNASPPPATAETGELKVLPPGAYGLVTVEENASLELTSGTYHIDSLEVHALGSVRVRANAGPVVLNVRNTLELFGSVNMVAGNASQFLVVYLGTAAVALTAPLFATVFAPQADVTLNPGVNGAEFVGAFFAAQLTTLDDVVVRQQAFFDAPTPFVARYFYGFMGPVGAGPYERTLAVPPELSQLEFGGGALPELHEDLEDGDGNPTIALTIGRSDDDPPVLDSRTYTLVIADGGSDANRIETVIVQAAEGTRPFVTITGGDDTNAANLTPATRATSTPPRRFEVDGVWFGTSDDSGATQTRDFVIAPSDPAATSGVNWDEIVIRHSTFDPGGLRADRTRIAALKLNVTGKVTKIRIERSIVGPIEVTGDGLVDEIEITDSIVDASQLEPVDGRRIAIRSGNGIVRLKGVTVFGDIQADILEASDSLVTGQLVVADTQASCFRFSAASEGPSERLPRLFQSTIAPGGIEPSYFTSQRFGDPGYAQIAELVPDFIATGAENGSELGAFSFLLAPIRLASILAKVDEFKPIGVIAQYILEGEQGEDAAQ